MFMKSIGSFMCMVGLLVALAASAKPPTEHGAWPDTVPYAAAGLLLALTGVVIWRRQQRSLNAEHSSQQKEQKSANLQPLWTAFLQDLQALNRTSSSMTLAEIASRLQHLHDQFILPLSQARMAFFVRSGSQHGVERLTAFSRGELWLNRAQSTAGDQHKEETLAALTWAEESFQEVQNLFSSSSH